MRSCVTLGTKRKLLIPFVCVRQGFGAHARRCQAPEPDAAGDGLSNHILRDSDCGELVEPHSNQTRPEIRE